MYQNVRDFVTRSLNKIFISMTLKGNYTKQFNKSHVGHLRNIQKKSIYPKYEGEKIIFFHLSFWTIFEGEKER